jgi:hypothetical protein
MMCRCDSEEPLGLPERWLPKVLIPLLELPQKCGHRCTTSRQKMMTNLDMLIETANLTRAHHPLDKRAPVVTDFFEFIRKGLVKSAVNFANEINGGWIGKKILIR